MQNNLTYAQFASPLLHRGGGFCAYKSISYKDSPSKYLLDTPTIKAINTESDIFENSVNPAPTQYPGYPLMQGMSDEALKREGRTISTPIKNLQVMLREISFYNPEVIRVIPTHSFGNTTYDAVVSFQTFYNLEQNGIVDFLVWQEIYNYYKEALKERDL